MLEACRSKSAAFRKALWPLSSLYLWIGEVRNYAFEKNILRTVKLSKPVISIGNLTFGGTGKTPVTDFLLKQLTEKGLKIGLVSRSYKVQNKNIQKVDIQNLKGAFCFGDEPMLLAKKHPNIPVYVGPTKYKTAQRILEEIPLLHGVLVDDGFQHRFLHRDLDILVIDATENEENYQVFPLGRARESFHNYRRADLVFLTKANLVSTAQVEKWKTNLIGKPVFEFDYQISIVKWQNQAISVNDLNPCHPSMAICGLAQPQSFFELLNQKGLRSVNQIFPDHHPYSEADVSGLIKAADAQKICQFITTEKDYVKLSTLWPKELPLYVTQLELVPRFSLESLYAYFWPMFN